uniref:Cytochrome b n=1 Tax=Rediviva intermixta TaxID=1688786 RepID=A0A172CM01_9HYME|nr:cytochrome b [Rediviva intermixta]AKS40066.1 cytochrome b [Rediviva intermixta]
MKKIKLNPIMKIFMNSLILLPTPMNINYWWNFGSILGVCLLIQIISGFLLSLHYCPNINLAFDSVVHIMNNVNFGWLIRLIHLNGASMYFIIMYIHIGRNLYYQTFNLTYVWFIGITIFLLSMMTAFLGYVLPWGQMSFWGATVITNLLSAIPTVGSVLVEWIWGGFSINNATLNRFYSFHFILPLIILILVILHLFFLHLTGSNNPVGNNSDYYKISFNPYYLLKDILGFSIMLNFLFLMVFINPYYLGDPDNFILANSMSTPNHIKPEWYFLFAYTILRTIPNKLGGVMGLLMSILILYIMPFLNLYKFKSSKFYPLNQIMFWSLITSFIMLTWLGGQLIEYPYFELSTVFTISYFMYFLLMPMLNLLWDILLK